MVDSIVSAENLSVRRGGAEILSSVSITVPSEGKVLIQGPSGSGKTTLFEVLALLDTPNSGSLHIAGNDVANIPERKRSEIRRDVVGIVFQDFQLIPDLTARENAQLPQEHRNAIDDEWINKLFRELDIESLEDQYPATLSGGEKQRVAIARALANKPTVVFADEPTGQLDPDTASRVLDILLEVRDLTETALVVVSHDRNLMKEFNTVYHLEDGKLSEENPHS